MTGSRWVSGLSITTLLSTQANFSATLTEKLKSAASISLMSSSCMAQDTSMGWPRVTLDLWVEK